tara:strand:- start:1558 stop:2139 length:582 start_codon:yes stop_codon:yes gene_type:complete
VALKDFRVKNGLSTPKLTVDGTSELGEVANVSITGGVSGQSIITDGSGVLSFGNPTSSDPIAPMPTLIETGVTETVPTNYQGLFGYPIEVDGTLEIDGVLIDVNSDSLRVGGSNNQVQFNNGTDEKLGSSANLTFDTQTQILHVTGITQTGSYSNIALPDSVPGGLIYITNGNNKPAYGDGTNWYYFDNTQVT